MASDAESIRRRERTCLLGRLDIAQAFLEIYKTRIPHHGLALWVSIDDDGYEETLVYGDWPAIPNVRKACVGFVPEDTVPDDLEDAETMTREKFDEIWGGQQTPDGERYVFELVSSFLNNRVASLKQRLVQLDKEAPHNATK